MTLYVTTCSNAQPIITHSIKYVRTKYQEIIFYKINPFRSACENPEKAMTLVSAAKLVPGYTGKYEGLVNIVNRAASKGLDGENCDYLSL